MIVNTAHSVMEMVIFTRDCWETSRDKMLFLVTVHIDVQMKQNTDKLGLRICVPILQNTFSEYYAVNII